MREDKDPTLILNNHRTNIKAKIRKVIVAEKIKIFYVFVIFFQSLRFFKII